MPRSFVDIDGGRANATGTEWDVQPFGWTAFEYKHDHQTIIIKAVRGPMPRIKLASLLLVLACAAPVSGNALAQGDAATGGAIAERWCASCHLVSPDQTGAMADVPSFTSIAERYESDIAALEGFLADPHPPMPDMSLTRNEIRDLLAYIGSLRD